MKIKVSAETLIYVAVIILALIALILSCASYQFTDTKLIYEGF